MTGFELGFSFTRSDHYANCQPLVTWSRMYDVNVHFLNRPKNGIFLYPRYLVSRFLSGKFLMKMPKTIAGMDGPPCKNLFLNGPFPA